ncbi:MAG: nickel-dependent hydrogenase large subunit [Oscillospiraceae bacterium]|nr:nickel-dependent hydrogenase large subunit [Oscillospiraceae bacterium]
MAETMVINPLFRVGGKLEVSVRIEQGIISKAMVSGLVRRNFESGLVGERVDAAWHKAARLCAFCGESHRFAAEKALGIIEDLTPLDEFLLAFNIAVGHIKNFYCNILPDYVLFKRGVPFIIGGESADIRFDKKQNDLNDEHRVKVMREICAAIKVVKDNRSKKIGVIDALKIENAILHLKTAYEMMCEDHDRLCRMYEDMYAVGGGSTNFIDFGGLPRCSEKAAAVTPIKSVVPNLDKVTRDTIRCWRDDRGKICYENKSAYSHLFLAEYDGMPYEMGAIARQKIKGKKVRCSVMDRIDAITEECGDIIHILPEQLEAAGKMGEGKMYRRPSDGKRIAVIPASGGSVIHSCRVVGGIVKEYRITSPCNWNLGPQDVRGNPSPVQTALLGTEVPDREGAEVVVSRIVHSFVPCIYCGG